MIGIGLYPTRTLRVPASHRKLYRFRPTAIVRSPARHDGKRHPLAFGRDCDIGGSDRRRAGKGANEGRRAGGAQRNGCAIRRAPAKLRVAKPAQCQPRGTDNGLHEALGTYSKA